MFSLVMPHVRSGERQCYYIMWRWRGGKATTADLKHNKTHRPRARPGRAAGQQRAGCIERVRADSAQAPTQARTHNTQTHAVVECVCGAVPLVEKKKKVRWGASKA